MQNWARKHNLLTKRPLEPTFVSSQGESRVDIIFHRIAVPPLLTVLSKMPNSDHRAVIAKM